MIYKVKFDDGCGDHFVAIVEAKDKEQARERGVIAAMSYGQPHLDWLGKYVDISVDTYDNPRFLTMPWLIDWDEQDHESPQKEPRYG